MEIIVFVLLDSLELMEFVDNAVLDHISIKVFKNVLSFQFVHQDPHGTNKF
jgi:hypothetical protein